MGSGKFAASPAQQRAAAAVERTVSDALVDIFRDLGVKEAFGIVGGAIAPFCDVMGKRATSAGAPRVIAMRHEAGAAFAACEASLATGRPTLVFTTTGPGLTNAITAAYAAKSEGARVVIVCGATSPAHRGRGAVQETSDHALFKVNDIAAPFDLVVTVESQRELPVIANRLAHGFARPGGYVALISLPLVVQRAPLSDDAVIVVPRPMRAVPWPQPAAVVQLLDVLAEPFAIWVGFGARNAAPQVRALAEQTGARVFCTPRGKGIFPEDHPLFVGVTGFGGHAVVEDVLESLHPKRVLVLGTRLGEYSSVWDARLIPMGGLIHVDVDESAFGAAYPNVPTLPILADIGALLDEVLAMLPSSPAPSARPRSGVTLVPRTEGPVRPQALMQSIQRIVVDGSDAIVMAEPGNSFAWTNHHLRFPAPRYRMSGSWASMGHMTTGAVGAALAANRTCVVVTGDGSMLMLSELSSAANYGARVVWIVLNDGRYGITEAGMGAQGFTPVETRFPKVDFVALAKAMGCDGAAVTCERDLDDALERALAAHGPFVVDVDVDVNERAPFLRRIHALAAMGAHRGER